MADIKELADILGNYQHIIDHAVNNFEKLKQRADSAEIIRFGTESNGLGRLYPEIYRKLVKVSCGRYLKKTPQTESRAVIKKYSNM